jgi:plasmid stabilization system protein ParE
MARRPARMSAAARSWYLAEIRYLADRDPETASRVVDMFRTATLNLGAYPKIGVAGLIPGTRRLVVGPYVLTTQQRQGIVEVLAIRHARQQDAYEPSDVRPDEEQ